MHLAKPELLLGSPGNGALDGGKIVRRGRDERGSWYEIEYVDRKSGKDRYEARERHGRYKW